MNLALDLTIIWNSSSVITTTVTHQRIPHPQTGCAISIFEPVTFAAGRGANFSAKQYHKLNMQRHIPSKGTSNTGFILCQSMAETLPVLGTKKPPGITVEKQQLLFVFRLDSGSPLSRLSAGWRTATLAGQPATRA